MCQFISVHSLKIPNKIASINTIKNIKTTSMIFVFEYWPLVSTFPQQKKKRMRSQHLVHILSEEEKTTKNN